MKSQIRLLTAVSCVVSVNSIDENKILNYLAGYDSAFLYQKTGFIFSEHRTELCISDVFIMICKNRSGNSKRYLEFLNTQEYICEHLLLKGGTAINLTVFILPRLSVDIDLDFIPNLTREETANERARLTIMRQNIPRSRLTLLLQE